MLWTSAKPADRWINSLVYIHDAFCFALWLIADDDSGEKSVSVLLSGEESEITFIDHAYIEMTVSSSMLFDY